MDRSEGAAARAAIHLGERPAISAWRKAMTKLFTQYWDVIPGKFDAYSTFVTNEYMPMAEKLGIKLLGGYYVAVGEGPRIVVVATVNETDQLRSILATEEYRILSGKLMRLISNYGSKLWVSSGKVREGPYKIQTGAWKFNQYYNVIPGKEEDHYRFVKEECVPGMEALGVPVTQGWRLVIGSGPRILAECTARKLENIAKAIDTSEFRRLVRTLKKEIATDYSSRILAPTGRIEIPTMLSEMMKGFLGRLGLESPHAQALVRPDNPGPKRSRCVHGWKVKE